LWKDFLFFLPLLSNLFPWLLATFETVSPPSSDLRARNIMIEVSLPSCVTDIVCLPGYHLFSFRTTIAPDVCFLQSNASGFLVPSFFRFYHPPSLSRPIFLSLLRCGVIPFCNLFPSRARLPSSRPRPVQLATSYFSRGIVLFPPHYSLRLVFQRV